MLPPFAKLLAVILLARLEAHPPLLAAREPAQVGFRAHHRLEDNLLLAQHLVLRAIHASRPTAFLFLDVEKAYDRLDRRALWDTLLTHYHLPPALVGALQRMYVDLEACVR